VTTDSVRADKLASRIPRFSVIVPSRDRPEALERCLKALALLDYPHDDFEVVVVDNRSKTPPSELVERFSARLRVRLLEESRPGPAAARNAGAAAAEGRLLAFTDDDCEPAPGWLVNLERRLTSDSSSLVGGSILNALPRNPYSCASQAVMDAVYEHYNSTPTAARFLVSNNMALPAALFRELGGFDTSFPRAGGEDREFCYRCERQGTPMIYAPDAVVAHAHHLTLRSLWQQHFRYGRGTRIFHVSRRAAGGGRVRVEPGLHVALMRTTLRGGSSAPRLGVIAGVLVTQLAYAAGFARELSRRHSSDERRVAQ
jgi:GT2 family glycosyltransferase